MSKWWNITILSAFSNLNLGFYDSMVFWYFLSPQKIQLLLKNHHFGNEEANSLIKMVENEDVLLEEYDQKVLELLKAEINMNNSSSDNDDETSSLNKSESISIVVDVGASSSNSSNDESDSTE